MKIPDAELMLSLPIDDLVWLVRTTMACVSSDDVPHLRGILTRLRDQLGRDIAAHENRPEGRRRVPPAAPPPPPNETMTKGPPPP